VNVLLILRKNCSFIKVYIVAMMYTLHRMLTIDTDVRGLRLSCHAALIDGGACSVGHVLRVRGHSIQPSPNAFGLLLDIVCIVWIIVFYCVLYCLVLS